MANFKTDKGLEKSTNLVILEIKQNIISLLESAKLPIVVNQMILNEIKSIIDGATNDIVKKDKFEYEEYLKTKKEGEK